MQSAAFIYMRILHIRRANTQATLSHPYMLASAHKHTRTQKNGSCPPLAVCVVLCRASTPNTAHTGTQSDNMVLQRRLLTTDELYT